MKLITYALAPIATDAGVDGIGLLTVGVVW